MTATEATWRCDSCRHTNLSSDVQCIGCGAERPSGSRRRSRVWCRVIAILEIAGGGLGVLAAVSMVSQLDPAQLDAAAASSTGAELLRLVSFLIFALSLSAGIGLWRDTSWGLKLSRLVQGLQLVGVSSPFVVYSLTSGVALSIGAFFERDFVDAQLFIHPNFGAELSFLGWTGAAPWGAGLNLVAVWAFWYLGQVQSRMNVDELVQSSSTITDQDSAGGDATETDESA
jgi:hypothetical protein